MDGVTKTKGREEKWEKARSHHIINQHRQPFSIIHNVCGFSQAVAEHSLYNIERRAATLSPFITSIKSSNSHVYSFIQASTAISSTTTTKLETSSKEKQGK